MSSQPLFPLQDANDLQRDDLVTQELSNDLDEYLANKGEGPESSGFGGVTYQGSTSFSFGRPSSSQTLTQYNFGSMEATQMNYDASQILEDENDPGYSDGSKEEEEEEAGGNLCLKTALIRTLTLQLSEANNEIEKLNCEIEQASDQPVVQVETISRLQTENQKLTSELETTQKALSEKESASNACDVGMAHQQGQSPSPLQLEIDELKDKLEDAMKQSQTNYDGWINADKQWKVEWTAAKEKSKADFDGCNAANNEARQNWDRYVCAAKNFKQEEEEVKRLRETARQVDHGRKWTDSQRDDFADRKMRNAVEFKNKEILELKSKLAKYKEPPEKISPLAPIPVTKTKDSEILELETKISQLCNERDAARNERDTARTERDAAVESDSNKMMRIQQLENQIQFSNDVGVGPSRTSTIQRLKSESEQYRATGRKYKARNAKITWTVQFLEKQSKNARAAGRRSALAEASMLADSKQLEKKNKEYEDKCQKLEAAAKDDQSTIQQVRDELKQLRLDKAAAETSSLNQKKSQEKRIEDFSKFEDKLRAGFSQLNIPVNLDDQIDVITFTYLRHVYEALEGAAIYTSYDYNPQGPQEQYIPDSARLIQTLRLNVIQLQAQLKEVETKLAVVESNPKSDLYGTDQIQESKPAVGKTKIQELSLEGEAETAAQMKNEKVEDLSSEGELDKAVPGRSYGFSYPDESDGGDDRPKTKDDDTTILSTPKIADIDVTVSQSGDLNPSTNLANSSSTRRLRKVTFAHPEKLETIIPQPVYLGSSGQASVLPKQEGLNNKESKYFLGLILANPASTQFPQMVTFAQPKNLKSIVRQPKTLELPEQFHPPSKEETLRHNEPKTLLIPNPSPETISTNAVDGGTRDLWAFMLLILLTCISIGPMLVWGYLDVEPYVLSLLCDLCISFHDQISMFLIVTCMLSALYFRGGTFMRMLPDA